MMRALRSWPWLVLLHVAVDLVDPGTPGVFSLLRHDLFVEGLTRPCGGDAEAGSVRDCRRPSVPVHTLPALAMAEASVERTARLAPRARHADGARAFRHSRSGFTSRSLDADDH